MVVHHIMKKGTKFRLNVMFFTWKRFWITTGQKFHCGIGTHAYSRIVYKLPEDYDTFAATIGCDQKALVGSLVFVVEGDGKELFRSPIFRADSTPMEIKVPIWWYD